MANVVEHRILHSGWGRFLVARIRLDGGEEVVREIEDHGHAVAVLPYCAERRTATLVGQMRAPVLFDAGLSEILEAPAGRIESDDPEADARREVEEEAGLRVGALEHVATTWPMPGISTERIALYLAPYAEGDRVAAGGGLAHEGEHIRVVEHSLSELAAMVAAGTLADMKTVLLLLALQLRRPELFPPVPSDDGPQR